MMKQLFPLILLALFPMQACKNHAPAPEPSVEPSPKTGPGLEKAKVNAAPKHAPAPKEAPDFKGARWGMSPEEVGAKGTVTDPTQRTHLVMAKECKVAGFPCIAGYGFLDGKLAKGVYTFVQTHSEPSDFLQDYKDLRDGLVAKYGDPIVDQTLWKKDTFKDDPGNWGLAVAMGQMVKVALWKTNRTNIQLGLMGDNSDISLGMVYYDLVRGDAFDKELNSGDNGL